MFSLSTFYRSRQWRDLVEALKLKRLDKNGELICEHCSKPITARYDCIGHHVVELTEDNVNDVSVSLNEANIKLIHFRCHNLIHQRFEGFYRQVFLVYGPPCAGKSTWVESVALADDLIVDIDSLWAAISICDKYAKPPRLKANAFGLRDCLLEQVKMRKGNWRNAYVVGGYPFQPQRERMCDILGAREVFINAPMSVCIERAKTDEWRRYVREWFDEAATSPP